MKILHTCAAAAVFALASSTGTAFAAEPVPLKDFVRQPEFLTARISPTGEYLAVAMPVEGQTAVGILNLKTRKVTGSLKWQRGDHVSDFWWVGPDRVVASLARSEGSLDQPRQTGQLYAINADGSKYRLLHEMGYLIDPLPRDPSRALIFTGALRTKYEDDSIYVDNLNVNHGGSSHVARLPGQFPLDVVTDGSGNVRFAYTSTRDGGLKLWARDEKATIGWTPVAHPKGDPETIELQAVTADGASVFLTTTEQGGRACLREYRAATRKLEERSCSDSGVVGRPLLSFDQTTLIALDHGVDQPELEFLDANHADAKLLQLLMRSFKGQRVRVLHWTLDGKTLVLSVSSDRNPGDFYLVDRDTKKAEYLMSRNAWIDPAAMAPVSTISYKARDGTTIEGYLTAAKGMATRKAPLVLMPHGGPHGIRDYWTWNPWAQALATRGYAVLQVNFRGSGGYGYAHEQAGYEHWGTLMQDDMTDGVKWAVAQGIADPARMCVMGASYGGYSSLMQVVREPDLYKCAIPFAGVYDLVDHADDCDFCDTRRGDQFYDETLGNKQQRREQSPLTYIERLKVPVLIAHGTDDERVPFAQAKMLRKALDKLGKPYEWAEYKGEEHGFYVEANHVDFLNKALAFLDKHIGPGATAAASQGTTAGK